MKRTYGALRKHLTPLEKLVMDHVWAHPDTTAHAAREVAPQRVLKESTARTVLHNGGPARKIRVLSHDEFLASGGNIENTYGMLPPLPHECVRRLGAAALLIFAGFVTPPFIVGQSRVTSASAAAQAGEDAQVAATTTQQGAIEIPSEKRLSFDVASIKMNNSSPVGREPEGGTLRFNDARVVGRKVTVKRMIQAAYRLTEYQVSGGPRWIDSDAFDVEAKAGTLVNEDQLRQMLQTLLAERFKLAAHHQSKEMPVAFLTLGPKGLGPALHEVKDGTPLPKAQATEFVGHQMPGPTVVMRGTLQDFAIELSGPPFGLGRIVVDKTDLHGKYFGFLHWGQDDDAISALRDEFDLKLEVRKAPADILVIDRLEKPSTN